MVKQKFFPILSLWLCALLLFAFSGCKTLGAGGSEVLSSSGIEEDSSAVSSESEKIENTPTPTPTPTPEPTPEPEPTPPPLQASLKASAPLYEKAALGEPMATLPAGQVVNVKNTADPLWYAVSDMGAGSGYLYAENLFRVQEDGTVSSKSLFEEYAGHKFDYLQSRLPEGTYWNHMGRDDISYAQEVTFVTTEIPCIHSTYGELYCNFYNGATKQLFFDNTLCECLGFASLLSDQVFGESAPLHVFHDSSLLRVGDHIRLDEYEHSMTVVEIHEDYLVIAEANAGYEDCLIAWKTQLTWDRLRNLSWDSWFISRYPLRPDGNGGYVAWN